MPLQELNLAHVFPGAPAVRYRTRAMAARAPFGNGHYVAVVDLGRYWVKLDDTSCKVIGSWAELKDDFQKSRLQPEAAIMEAM